MDDMNKQPNEPSVPENTTPPVGSQIPQQKSNKTLIRVIAGVLIVLVLVLAGLIALYIMKQKQPTSSESTSSSQGALSQQNDTASTAQQERTVALTTSIEDGVQLIIYKPVQNQSNTTLYYALKNTTDQVKSANYLLYGVYNDSNTYLVEGQNAIKYGVALDSKGSVLHSTCPTGLQAGATSTACFVSFAKVPSGKTVTFVLNTRTIGDVTIP